MVFAFWSRPTGQRSIVAGDLLVVDHFSQEAIAAAIEFLDTNVVPHDLDELLAAAGGDLFEDSLEVNARQLWTPALLAEFERRRGYDLRPFLPVLCIDKLHLFVEGGMAGITPASPSDFDLPDGMGERVRQDYYRTLNELYVDHHVKPLRRWANSRGLRFRAQPYGGTIDPIEAAAEVEVPECENLGPLWFSSGTLDHPEPLQAPPDPNIYLDHVRAIAAAGHMRGQETISIEAYCVYSGDYRSSLAATKRHLDYAFTAGVTQLVNHGYAYDQVSGEPWPGWSPFSTEGLPDGLPFAFSEAWGPRQPMWRHMRAFADYAARCGVLLRHGRPRVDVAVFRQEYWSHGWPAFTAPELGTAGYTYEFVSPALLSDPAVVYADGRLAPDRAGYRVLVVDEPAMDPVALAQICALAGQGLPIVLVGGPPSRAKGFGGDAEVRALADQLLRQPRVRIVDHPSQVAESLRTWGIPPAVEPAEPAPVRTARRAAADGDYYFVFNPASTSVQVSLSVELPVEGTGQARLLDLWNGTLHPVQHRPEPGPGRCIVDLELGAGETIGLHIGGGVPSLDAIPVSFPAMRRRGPAAWSQPITGWQLDVEDWTPTGRRNHTLHLDQPLDWRDIPALAEVSGVGTYKATFDLPDSWDTDRAGVHLDLGRLAGSVQVRINGRLASNNCVTGPGEISHLLRTGDNRIEIEVATTLHNRLVSLASNGADGYARFKTRQPEPAGLLDPIRLTGTPATSRPAQTSTGCS